MGKHGPPPTTTTYLKIGYERAHRVVLMQKIGTAWSKCYWCRRPVAWNGQGRRKLVADHLDGDTWNNDPKNLVPSCRTCNAMRSRRPDIFTHCSNGHPWTPKNTYRRPDGTGRMCRTCCAVRERQRVRA